MINRLIKLPKRHSFFLFGPRQTGKSTLLKSFLDPRHTLTYDLLNSDEYLRLSKEPSLLREEINTRDKSITHVVVDEVQKIPAILDEIHLILESKSAPHFCLSGSSARKLKKAHSNLLAGRAWTYNLYPLTHTELGKLFSMERALNLGTLPSVYLSKNEEDARRTLRAYVETYLKEEIQQEALVRNLGGFLRFLTLAADENGNVINYSNIARETGTSYQTVKDYFQILEDTLVGFLLLPYSKSTRKRLIRHPKFYFFDTGVHRAIMKKITVPLERKTSEYGRSFEHFMIVEILRVASYKESDYKFSFYHSSNHMEVDLIVETPKNGIYAIEIKATDHPNKASLGGLRSFAEVRQEAKLICASLAPRPRILGDILILPWRDVFKEIGLGEDLSK